jgi:hypothetical protein
MKKFTINAGIFLTADNIMIDFGDDIQEPKQIAIGCTGKIDRKLCEGEYLMPDGRWLTFKDGKLIKIQEPTKASLIKISASLRKSNAALKGQLKDTYSLIQEISDDILKLQKDMKALLLPRKPFNKVIRKPSGRKRPFV